MGLCCSKRHSREASFSTSKPAPFIVEEPEEGTLLGTRVEEGSDICNKCKYSYRLRCVSESKCEYTLQVDESFLKRGEKQLTAAPFELGGLEILVCLLQTRGELKARLKIKQNARAGMNSYIAIVSTKANRTIVSESEYYYSCDGNTDSAREYTFLQPPECRTIRQRSLGYINEGTFTVRVCADLLGKFDNSQLAVVSQDGNTCNLKWTLNEMDTLPGASKSFAECALGSGILWLTFYPKGRRLYGKMVDGAGVVLSLTVKGRPVPFRATMTIRSLWFAEKTVTKSGVSHPTGNHDVVFENILHSNDSVHDTPEYIASGIFEMTFEIKSSEPLILTEEHLKKDYFGTESTVQEEDLVPCILCERNLSNATIVHEDNVYRECRIVCMDCGRDLQRQVGALCPKCNERFQRVFET